MTRGDAESYRFFTPGEEIANWITHGLAALAAVVGAVVLAGIALERGDAWHIVGCTVFGITLVMLYAASAIYHAMPADFERAKRRWKTADHSAIYLLIAGSYTPFMLVNLRGPWGWSLLAVVWSMATFGILCETTRLRRFSNLRVGVYLTMGWSVVVAAKPIIDAMPVTGLALIVLGGLAYTGGVTFYVWHRLRYHHAIWHSCVVAGSALHYAAVLWYVLPTATLS